MFCVWFVVQRQGTLVCSCDGSFTFIDAHNVSVRTCAMMYQFKNNTPHFVFRGDCGIPKRITCQTVHECCRSECCLLATWLSLGRVLKAKWGGGRGNSETDMTTFSLFFLWAHKQGERTFIKCPATFHVRHFSRTSSEQFLKSARVAALSAGIWNVSVTDLFTHLSGFDGNVDELYNRNICLRLEQTSARPLGRLIRPSLWWNVWTGLIQPLLLQTNSSGSKQTWVFVHTTLCYHLIPAAAAPTATLKRKSISFTHPVYTGQPPKTPFVWRL